MADAVDGKAGNQRRDEIGQRIGLHRHAEVRHLVAGPAVAAHLLMPAHHEHVVSHTHRQAHHEQCANAVPQEGRGRTRTHHQRRAQQRDARIAAIEPASHGHGGEHHRRIEQRSEQPHHRRRGAQLHGREQDAQRGTAHHDMVCRHDEDQQVQGFQFQRGLSHGPDCGGPYPTNIRPRGPVRRATMCHDLPFRGAATNRYNCHDNKKAASAPSSARVRPQHPGSPGQFSSLHEAAVTPAVAGFRHID